MQMTFLEHCEQAEKTFGNRFDYVHNWLDEFAGKPPHGMRHRKFRHHLEGIETIRKLWGDDAALAARQHIESDLAQEGWTKKDHFPKNQIEYMRMGLF